MILPSRFTSTIKDDAGKPVRLLDPAGMSEWPSKGDGRIGTLVTRLRLMISQVSGLTVLVGIAAAVIVWIGYGAVVPLINRIVPAIPGIVHLVIAIVIIRLLIGLAWRTGLYFRRREVARIILAEGLCPCCGYNFAGLRLEQAALDQLVSCPECGAAWRRCRIIRVEAFDPGLPTALPTTLVRKRVTVPRWSIPDDRGVPARLVHPRLRGYARLQTRGENRLERLAAARAKISRSGRWPRLLISSTFFATAITVAGLSWEDRGERVAGLVHGGVMAMIGAGVLWGNFLYGKRAVRDALVEQGLCPGCTHDLRSLKVLADGCAECPVCRSTWRKAPPTEAP